MNAIAVTFDIDWAPDWCVKECANLCRRFARPATFFATHRSDVLADLAFDPSVEIGIHPNFLPASSHGGTVRAVLDFCCDLVPNATSMRSHCLFQSSPILKTLCMDYPSIKYDASLFLPFHPNLSVTRLYFDKDHYVARVPSLWADDIAAIWPGWSWRVGGLLQSPGLKVFNFHPVHVALNTRNEVGYIGLKEALGDRPLWTAKRCDFEPYVASGMGCRQFLEQLLSGDGVFKRIMDLEAVVSFA